jgi:hypothetical protein
MHVFFNPGVLFSSLVSFLVAKVFIASRHSFRVISNNSIEAYCLGTVYVVRLTVVF